MRQQRTYSQEEKAAAMAALDANEGNVRGTAQQLGIPRDTLLTWRDVRDGKRNNQKQPIGGGQASRLAAKLSLADAFERIAWRVARLAPKAAKVAAAKGNFSQLMVGGGIAVDKMRLLREQATSLPGQALSPEEKDKRIREIQAAAAARRALAEAEKATPPPATDPPQVSPQHDVDALVDLAQPHPDRPKQGTT